MAAPGPDGMVAAGGLVNTVLRYRTQGLLSYRGIERRRSLFFLPPKRNTCAGLHGIVRLRFPGTCYESAAQEA
jgi:hypothetical protein